MARIALLLCARSQNVSRLDMEGIFYKINMLSTALFRPSLFYENQNHLKKILSGTESEIFLIKILMKQSAAFLVNYCFANIIKFLAFKILLSTHTSIGFILARNIYFGMKK